MSFILLFLGLILIPSGAFSYPVYYGDQNLNCVLAYEPPINRYRERREVPLNDYAAVGAASLVSILIAPIAGIITIPFAATYIGGDVESRYWHESIRYQNFVFEWGTNGLHIAEGKTLTPGCNLEWTYSGSSNAPLDKVIDHAKRFASYGQYDMLHRNCHDFATYMRMFLLDLKWTTGYEEPIYFNYQKATCYDPSIPDSDNIKVNYIEYNNSFIGWNDLTDGLTFNTSENRPFNNCMRFIKTAMTYTSTCPINKVLEYTKDYNDVKVYNTKIETEPNVIIPKYFHTSSMFVNRLTDYMKTKCVNSRYNVYEIGIQYDGCISRGYRLSTSSPYHKRLLFEGKVFQWDYENNFIMTNLSTTPRCPIHWETSGKSSCSLKDAYAYGLIYQFFKGSYSSDNKGYMFIDNLEKWLDEDCSFSYFPCQLESYYSNNYCGWKGKQVFKMFYQRFKGTKGIFFNTCSTYDYYYRKYVTNGWCRYIDNEMNKFIEK